MGELILILIVALLLFGKRLPEVSRSVGKGIREFQKGMRGIEEEIRREVNTEPPAAPSPPPAPSDGAAPSGGPAGARIEGPPPGTGSGLPA
ncbi:MAG: twin-arginine translocase TatA/TatE family subunit [Planctomycetota bacterium]